MRYTLLILFFCLSLSSCSKLSHLNELLTLKSVSDEQAAMAKDVAATNKKFDELALAVKSGEVKEFKTTHEVEKKFGPPILKDQKTRNEEIYDVWLYRYATEFFGSDKVYLSFDPSGKLEEWEYVEAAKETVKNGGAHEQIRKETTQ